MAEREKLIELKDLQISFGTGRKKFVAVDHVNFDIYKGETFSLVGESGSGKTTIGRAILRINPTSAGDIYFKGQKINGKISKELDTEVIRKCQMIFQDPMASLNERAKVDYIVSEGLINFHLYKDEKEREEKVQKVLREVGLLPEFASRFPHEFSGGQRQRVAFARALAPNPQLLLLDEPFAAIDAKIRTELRSWLKDMIEKLGITSIFVTHDQDEAIEVADEIIITNRGRIEQKGTPLEVYQNPDTAFTAGFFGQTSVIDNYQVFNHFEEVPGGEKAIVRPEFVKVTKKNEEQKYKSSATEGVVERVAFRGSSLELKVRVGDTVLSARRSLDEEPVREGEVVDVFVQRIFVTKGNEAVLLHNTAMVEDWLVI